MVSDKHIPLKNKQRVYLQKLWNIHGKDAYPFFKQLIPAILESGKYHKAHREYLNSLHDISKIRRIK